MLLGDANQKAKILAYDNTVCRSQYSCASVVSSKFAYHNAAWCCILNFPYSKTLTQQNRPPLWRQIEASVFSHTTCRLALRTSPALSQSSTTQSSMICQAPHEWAPLTLVRQLLAFNVSRQLRRWWTWSWVRHSLVLPPHRQAWPKGFFTPNAPEQRTALLWPTSSPLLTTSISYPVSGWYPSRQTPIISAATSITWACAHAAQRKPELL